nr:hypothetical protein [Corynebacterium freiburgense]
MTENNSRPRRSDSRGQSQSYRGSRNSGGYRGDRSWGERNDDRRGGYRTERGDSGGRGRRYEEQGDERRKYRSGDREGGGRRFERQGERRHSQRAGAGRKDDRTRGPHRPGFREERLNKRQHAPTLPDDITARDLDPSILQDLKSLSKDNADTVGRHMVMAAVVMEEDPQLALRHARAAKDRAGRVAVVRETCGIAAYHAGEWKEALSELRAARRMSGGPGLLAVMADCERGLGRPEKALEIIRTEDLSKLDEDSRVELAIVVAGARQDMGHIDAAIAELQRVLFEPTRTGMTASRLFYAYADALAMAGRNEDAKTWFTHAANADVGGFLDAKDRIAELETQH